MTKSLNSTRQRFGLVVALVLSVIAIGSVAGCKSAASTKAKDIAVNYTNYQKITAQPVFVNPDLARLCVGASVEQVKQARKNMGLTRTRRSRSI